MDQCFAVFDIDRRVVLGGCRRVHGDSAHIFLSFSPRCSLSIPDTIIQIFIQNETTHTPLPRARRTSRPAFSSFGGDFNTNKKAFQVPSSSSVSLSRFSRLSVVVVVVLLLLLLLLWWSCFFFVSTFSTLKRKVGKKKIQKYQQRESIFLCTITRNAPLRELAQKTKSRLGEQGSLGSLGWRLWNQRPKHTKGRKESHLKRDLGIYS